MDEISGVGEMLWEHCKNGC